MTDNYGNDYDYAFVNEERFTKLEYLINSKFKHLEGIIYIPEDENDYGFSSLVIKGDGFVLYSSPLVNKTSRPVAFDVDITRFDSLIIEWRIYGITTSYHLKCCLGNIHLFYGSEGTVNNKDYSALPISLLDLRGIGSESRRIEYLTDTVGNSYNLAIFNDRDHTQPRAIPIFEYLLDLKYRKFECTLYIPENHRPYNPIVMIVIADGNEIYRSPEITERSGPVSVEIDLSDCNDFQITFSKYASSGSDSNTLCLADPYFYLREDSINE